MLAAAATAAVFLATQQQPTAPPPIDVSNLPLNLSLTQWLLLMFGTIGLAAMGKSIVTLLQSLVGMVKSFADWIPEMLTGRTKARDAETKAKEADTSEREEFTKLIEQFRTALDDNQKSNLTFAETINETQRLSNVQREQFNEERKTWEAKMTQLVEEGKVKDVTLEAQAQQILKLQAENERLQGRVVYLENELKKYDTGNLPTLPDDFTDPALKPTPPASDNVPPGEPLS